MDLIDMQSNIYDEMTWILHYQDHLTKFSHLWPLQNKQVSTISFLINLISFFNYLINKL